MAVLVSIIMMRGLLVLALYAVISAGEPAGKSHLQHMHLLFRHGDRTPIETFPNDGHQFNTTWPEGAGQLTQLGIEQQYLLGTWIRETYNYFIPRQYHASIFHMRSTDFDRTLMSAMANLAGLFRHSNSSLEKYNIHWRPIPVHTVKQTSEIMFASAPCPRFKQLLEESYKSDETKAFFDKHKTLFDLLRKESGWPELGAHNFWIIEDDLICLEAHNFSLPQWYTPAVKEEVGVVSEYLWKLRYSDTERLRLELGVFINDMIEHLDRVINPSASSPAQPVLSSRINAGHTAPKIMAYSAHDENVAALLSALGVYANETKPQYASVVLVELHGPEPPADPSAYHIRVRYKRSWQDPNGQYLSLPACTSSTASEGCEYKKLVEYLQPLRLQPEDFESACRTKIHRHSLFLFFGVAAFGLLLAFCGLVSTCVLVSRRRRRLRYETFTNELAF